MLSSPLPQRVRHKEFETGLSLALRLARRHGETWKIFASATGLPVSGLRLSENLPELSACSSVPADRLRPWTPTWMGHNVEVLGHHFDRSRFLRLNLRVCPHCMEEDVASKENGERSEDAAYLRLDWCLAFIFGCARHRVRLVSRCPRCDGRPKWNVGRIDACHCGASLLDTKPADLTDDEIAILIILRDRLHGRTAASDLLSTTSHVPLADLVNLLRLVGQVSCTGRKAIDSSAALEVENLSELLVRGASALDTLPGSFERVLDTLAAEGPGPHRGVVEVYGLPIVRWMRSDRPFIEVLRPIFDRHSASKATVPPSRLPGAPPSKYALDLARSRRVLTEPEMRRLVAAVGWTGVFPARRDEVRAAVADELLIMNHAAAHIGVPWRCLKRLREAHLVSPCWEVGPSGRHYYYRAELDALLETLAAGAPTFDEQPTSLVTLKRLSKVKAVEWWRLVEEVAVGRLPVAGVLSREPGVHALLFDPAAVASRFKVRPVDTLTKSAAKDLLGLIEAAWKAIDGSLLTATSNSLMTYVEWGEVQDFDERYISLRRLATLNGITTPKVRAQLAAAGVDSVVSGEGFAIYSRPESERVFPALTRWRVSREPA
jgi:hypothetical protein